MVILGYQQLDVFLRTLRRQGIIEDYYLEHRTTPEGPFAGGKLPTTCQHNGFVEWITPGLELEAFLGGYLIQISLPGTQAHHFNQWMEHPENEYNNRHDHSHGHRKADSQGTSVRQNGSPRGHASSIPMRTLTSLAAAWAGIQKGAGGFNGYPL